MRKKKKFDTIPRWNLLYRRDERNLMVQETSRLNIYDAKIEQLKQERQNTITKRIQTDPNDGLLMKKVKPFYNT